MTRVLRIALYVLTWLAMGWVLLRTYERPEPPEDLSD